MGREDWDIGMEFDKNPKNSFIVHHRDNFCRRGSISDHNQSNPLLYPTDNINNTHLSKSFLQALSSSKFTEKRLNNTWFLSLTNKTYRVSLT